MSSCYAGRCFLQYMPKLNMTQEYSRETVDVYPLGSLQPLNHPSGEVTASEASPLLSELELKASVQAQVYVWIAPTSLLVPQLWSYETFMRDCAHKWVGPGEDENEDYKEVDRRRDMNGIIERAAVNAVVNHVVN